MLLKFAKSAVIALIAVSAAAATHAQTVLANIALPNLPEQVAVSPLHDRIYVAVPNYGAEPFDYLTVINGRTNAIVTNIEIPPLAYAVAVDDLNGIVYAGGSFVDANGNTQNQVVVINPFDNKIIKTITVSNTAGNGILGLAANALDGELYVANASDNEVDVIRGFKVATRIATSDSPVGIAVNPLDRTVYASFAGGNMAVINGRTHEITTTVTVGTAGAGVAVNAANGHVFAANNVSSPDTPTVGVFDKAGTSLATVTVGNSPLGVDVDLITDLAFVANTGDNTISVISGKTNTVTATAPVSALFLAVNPADHKVYVSPANPVAELTVITEK
jgi:YVTN family beta-propeller protein